MKNVQKSDENGSLTGQQTESTDTTEEDTVSMKAIKAAENWILKGESILGQRGMTSSYSNANITIMMGNLRLAR